MDYLLWNELPTCLGNLVGGVTFVGAMIYATHFKTAPKRNLRSPRTARSPESPLAR